jgi:linoleoyl-CoA desaturase
MIVALAVLAFAKTEVGLCIMHDANHGTGSPHKWVNRLLRKTLLFAGLSDRNWREKHNHRHHAMTNVLDHDEDIDVAWWLLRFSEHKPHSKLHRWQYLYAWVLYGLQTIQWIFHGDFSMAWRYAEGKSTSYKIQRILNILLLKIIYLFFMIVLPVWMTPYGYTEVLIAFFVLHFVMGFVTAVVFQLAHVVEDVSMETEKDKSFVQHQFATTADFAQGSRLITALVGGLNFQVVHHLFPNICHVHYPALARHMRTVAEELGIEYHIYPTVIAALAAHKEQLRLLGIPD